MVAKVARVSSRVGPAHPSDLDCSSDVPLVKQEFKDECDVNLIIARCLKNGAPLPYYETVTPVFADVSDMGDYRQMVEQTRAAGEAFARLDPALRARFENDPAKLLDFLSDDKNYEEALTLGFLKPEAKSFAEAPPKPEPKAKPKGKGGDDSET